MIKRLYFFVITTVLVLISQPAVSDWEPLDMNGTETTWIYTPATTLNNGQHGLLVILHGCAQTAGDLKQFGNLQSAAEQNGLVLLVPYGYHYFGPNCWDYNQAKDKSGNVTELIAQTMALQARASLNIDSSRVYVVGLSSGAALSLLLGCRAPDLFAGIGAVAGPSVGSDQEHATNDASSIPSSNVSDATQTCRSLAGPKANFFATQIANIAYGDMDKNGPKAEFNYPPDKDHLDSYHLGRYSLVSVQWSLDNVRVLQKIYGTGDLGLPSDVQGGMGTEQTAAALDVTRLSLLVVHGVGHAWPAGTAGLNGPGSGGLWIAQQGFDYPAYVTRWLLDNSRRPK